jgi:hypothetical protein
MKKEKFNSILRKHVKEHLSPTKTDQNFITLIYESFQEPLDHSCLQIGSFSRFTAIHPLHDLDILYILGNWNPQSFDPSESLKKLHSKIMNEYKNPTKYKIYISLQTHSLSVSYNENNEEVFSVDIIPAYIFAKNEFDDDIYMVPEILKYRHGIHRKDFYQKVIDEGIDMSWIASDPNGYIEIAKRLNRSNQDFRKTVKFVKAWKNSCKNKDEDFNLKSFHIEQVISNLFKENIETDIFMGIFHFFINIPEIIQSAKIKDRVDNERYIDDYINDLTIWQKEKIINARDCFLIKLERFTENDSVNILLDACYYKRASRCEQFLFDFNIPTFLDDNYSFKIMAEVQERKGGFRKYILDKLGIIPIDRQINFNIKGKIPDVDLFKWKVKNDNSSREPRGEITDHHTRNVPEYTKYIGNHYVKCYAILNNTCVAKARQNVTLKR